MGLEIFVQGEGFSADVIIPPSQGTVPVPPYFGITANPFTSAGACGEPPSSSSHRERHLFQLNNLIPANSIIVRRRLAWFPIGHSQCGSAPSSPQTLIQPPE
jgi:hypothetical protein